MLLFAHSQEYCRKSGLIHPCIDRLSKYFSMSIRTTAIVSFLLLLLLPLLAVAQTDDAWPSLKYLRSDYQSVRVVAHVRIRDAEIVNRIPGYDNWKISAEVIEPFKGKFRKGDVIEYFHGAEAPSKKEFFSGEKIVFLLGEYDKEKKSMRYSVLENSTLAPAQNRIKKLRLIKNSFARARRR
jgi:hypothetical protein